MRLVALALGAALGLAASSASAQQSPIDAPPTSAPSASSKHLDGWPPATRIYSPKMLGGGIAVGLTGVANVVLGLLMIGLEGSRDIPQDSDIGSSAASSLKTKQAPAVLTLVNGGGMVLTGVALAIAGARRIDARAYPEPADVPYRFHSAPLLAAGVLLATTGVAVGAAGVGWYASHESTGVVTGVACAAAGLVMALGGVVAIGVGSTREPTGAPKIVLAPRGAGLRWTF